MNIRKAKLADAQSLITYFNKLVVEDTARVEKSTHAKEITLEMEKKWILQRLEKEENNNLFMRIIEDGGNGIVGSGEVERKSRWIEQHVAEIRYAILPSYKEHAHLLVGNLIDIAKVNNISLLIYFHLETQVHGLSTMKSLGFKEAGRFENYYLLENGEYVDRILLQKTL